MTDDLLTNLRTLLLAFPDVTQHVASRIRPLELDESDGKQTSIILELPDSDQFHTLDDQGCLLYTSPSPRDS